MYLEIISPEATLFTGEVDSVLVPGSTGSFQMLNNHASIVSTLKEGVVKISGKIDLDESVKDKFETEDANTTLFKINSGTV
jgi:F-type H+-transporting ATPase subunit epsilon